MPKKRMPRARWGTVKKRGRVVRVRCFFKQHFFKGFRSMMCGYDSMMFLIVEKKQGFCETTTCCVGDSSYVKVPQGIMLIL